MPAYKILKRDGLYRLFSNGVEVMARPKIDQVSQARDRLNAVFIADDDDAMNVAIDRLIDNMFEDEEE